MKVLIGSDYHCQPRLLEQALKLLPEVDGYINCGDFCTLAGSQPKAREPLGYDPKGQAEVELLQSFLQQVDQVGTPWIFLPGNHDPAPQVLSPLAGNHGTVAVASGLMPFLGQQVLLVPWTPPCGWSWTLTSTHLKELVATYTDTEVDILITHAPPRGVLDEGSKWYHRNMPTLKPLVDCVQPDYYFCGHMHLDGGKQVKREGTTYVNAALHNLVIHLEV